ncbi:MAG TPA: hypothetical protein VFB79_14260 [Candidatus Angelobacter sp.]|nr:hypothetical protein [Candidatus Angelobacter sp.]
MKTVLINPWFDIHSHEDPERLHRLLANDPGVAPRTAELLRRSMAAPGADFYFLIPIRIISINLSRLAVDQW